MIEKNPNVPLPDAPYPGIDPFTYSDRDIFFAREEESRALIRFVVIHRGVLFYADSGTGKSSLINAGLIHAAIVEGFQPEKLRVQPRKGEEIVVERLSQHSHPGPPYLPSIFAADENDDDIVLSVSSFLEIVKNKSQETYPLLIFDQFEEWFTLFEEGARGLQADYAKIAQESIRDAILSILWDSQLSVKLLLVLREDYLAKLTPFFSRYPDLPDQYLRLAPLKGEQIERIIRGPYDEYPQVYPNEIPVSMAHKIRTQFEDRSGGDHVSLSEVQIVCRTLYEAEKVGDQLEKYFDDLGGVQGILEIYLEKALETLPENQKDLSITLLSRMVTPVGTRNVISQDDLISLVINEEKITHRNLIKETLDNLEKETKLVRRERRREVYYYEIVSEFLVEWIQRKNRDRKEKKKIELLKYEKEEAQRGLETARGVTISYMSLRRFIGLLAIAFPFVLTFGGSIFNIPTQSSLFGYYYTSMRDIYVVMYAMIGVLLYFYRGYETADNIASNLGAVSAFGVAIFPTTAEGSAADSINYVHLAFLTLFYFANIYLIAISFTKTGSSAFVSTRRLQRNIIYRACGYTMMISLVILAIISFLPGEIVSAFELFMTNYWLEAMLFMAMGVAWFTKGQAILKDGIYYPE